MVLSWRGACCITVMCSSWSLESLENWSEAFQPYPAESLCIIISDMQLKCWCEGALFSLESITHFFSVLFSMGLSRAASACFLYCVFVIFCFKMYHGFPLWEYIKTYIRSREVYFSQKKYNLSFFFLEYPKTQQSVLAHFSLLCPPSLLSSLWPQVLQIFFSGSPVFSLSNPQFLWPRRIIEVWVWRRVLQSSFWSAICRMHE